MKHCRLAAMLAASFFGVFSFAACNTVKNSDTLHVAADYPSELLGVAQLNTVKRYTSTLVPREVTFAFDAGTNTVKFHHKMFGDNIWVYLTEENRAVMRQAIEAYLEAFSKQELNADHEKEKGFFGTTDVFMAWGLLGASHEAFPTLRFECQFITPLRPYFIIATATKRNSDRTNSPAIRIAVSPLQCKDILPFIEEDNLVDLANKIKKEYEKFSESTEKNSIDSIRNDVNKSDTPTETAQSTFDTF